MATLNFLVWTFVAAVSAPFVAIALVRRAQREADQFAEALTPYAVANAMVHGWGYIRVGSVFMDVVSPEEVDDIEELEESLYLEGLEIIEHEPGG